MVVFYFLASRTLILCCCFSYTDPFHLLDAWRTSPRSTTIFSSVLSHVSAGCACLRGELCSESHLDFHPAAMPNIFCPFFLVTARIPRNWGLVSALLIKELIFYILITFRPLLSDAFFQISRSSSSSLCFCLDSIMSSANSISYGESFLMSSVSLSMMMAKRKGLSAEPW